MTPPRSRLVDQSGRVLGQRALGTRQRILDATEQLLEQRKVRELKVVDIAREVGSSPATFYQYFKDVEEVVLQLAEQTSEGIPTIVEQIEGPWKGKQGLARARGIVDAFIRHWDRYHAVLRVRNLAAEEGDRRFRRVRAESLGAVLEALAKQIEREQQSGRSGSDLLHPYAAAAALVAILERLAAYHRELGAFGVSREDLVETSAQILHRTVTGRP